MKTSTAELIKTILHDEEKRYLYGMANSSNRKELREFLNISERQLYRLQNKFGNFDSYKGSLEPGGRMPVGMHRGKRMSQIAEKDKKYYEWILENGIVTVAEQS
jgi:hypothetical protein